MKTLFRSCLTFALAGWAAAALAQTTTSAPIVREREVTRTEVKLKTADRNFLEKAARASRSEAEISRVAAERTSNPEVRRFAQMLVADHDGVFEELAALASAKAVNLPAKEALGEKWLKHDAKNFDRDYIDKMVSNHEDTVKLFEKQAKDGDDPDAVAYARKHLPKLQSHLQQAVDLQRALKARR